MTTEMASARRDSPQWGSLLSGLIFYYSTSVVVLLGFSFGIEFLEPSPWKGHTFGYADEAYANWDGQWYGKIAIDGYDYRPDAHSSVAFFPAYPLLGRGIARVSGIRAGPALLVVSNLSLICFFCLMTEYVALRYPKAPRQLSGHVLLVTGLVPTSFFFRIAYSESLFLLLVMLLLWALERHWPLIAIACIIGAATATRPVGVGLIPALVLYAWRNSPRVTVFAVRAGYLLPIASWGIVAYMAYLYVEFGDPLAFARTQANWRLRPPVSLAERGFALMTLEPIRALYDPSGPGYWEKLTNCHNSIISLRAADPIYFLCAVILVVVGATKRWLNIYELVTSLSLLLIPYATIGYDQYMQSMGRYSSAVVPIYLVLGQLLSRVPAAYASCLAAISGFFLGIYSAMFSVWYMFI